MLDLKWNVHTRCVVHKILYGGFLSRQTLLLFLKRKAKNFCNYFFNYLGEYKIRLKNLFGSKGLNWANTKYLYLLMSTILSYFMYASENNGQMSTVFSSSGQS